MSKIAILGPKGSYCHIIAEMTFPKNEFLFCNTIEDIFRVVSSKEVEQGISPIENMLQGTVREAIFALKRYKVKINALYHLPIHHCLAALSPNFKKIISHPQAIGQCSAFLENYRKKGMLIEEVSSTSKAMEIASKDKECAAIGSSLAAKEFNLTVLKTSIEDNHDNLTSFILISNKENPINKSHSRSSILIHPLKDRPGLLYEILAIFKIKDINLTKIESIPSGKKIGDYLFFIEIEGNLHDENVKSALEFLRSIHEVYPFGSYEVKDFSGYDRK